MYIRVSTQMTSYGGKNADVIWRGNHKLISISAIWGVTSTINVSFFFLNWLGLKYTRFAITSYSICPTLLKSLSVGALLAGIALYRRTSATGEKNHSHGISTTGIDRRKISSPLALIVGNCKYPAISFATRSFKAFNPAASWSSVVTGSLFSFLISIAHALVS